MTTKKNLYLVGGLILCAVVFWCVARPGHRAVSPVGPVARTRQIAIVLDDWGYNLHQVPMLKEIKEPLTISILPGLPFSGRVATEAHARGDEVILHMPMEAENSHAPREKWTILTTLSNEQVLNQLDQSLATVPFVKGISNHQGSKATTDRRLMTVILTEARRRRLYFLDSFVTKQSVCNQAAHQVKIPFARRAVFLDNEEDPLLIRKNLLRLAAIATKKGRAIGIGHDRPHTLAVLKTVLPELKQDGYEIVPVSELTEVP